MTVSDLQFNNLLHEAKVIGCAYGGTHSADVGATVPFVSLAAAEIDPLKAALEILQRWDREPGDEPHLMSAIEEASVLVLETADGFSPVHQHLRATIRAELARLPARHAYYAAAIGRRLEGVRRLLIGHFSFSTVRVCRMRTESSHGRRSTQASKGTFAV